MKQYLDIIQAGESLSEDQMIDAMGLIMNGEADDADLESFLVGLAERGETVDEIVGAARVMRQKAAHIKAPEGAVDCCGTGGDGLGTYNISTAVALVAAASGVPVAKHGNRSASSKSGAADVLEALGVNLDVPQEKLEGALNEFGFAFLMAPHHHSAMKYVGPVRKKIGRRTIFNILGPLANPAGTKRQLIGVFDRQWLVPMAKALGRLGSENAWIVHGADGLDEITVTGSTSIAMLAADGSIEEKEINPADFGLAQHKIEELLGSTPEENAAALRAVLEGEKSAYRDIVVANTAATLVIHGKENDLKAAAALAQETLDNGKALKLLEDYAGFTQGAAQ